MRAFPSKPYEMNHLPRPCLCRVLAALVLGASPCAYSANIQSNYWYQSTITSDANGPLDLVAELNYDNTEANAPIVVVMHGYSGTTGKLAEVRAPAQRLRDHGFFAISVAMRQRDGSDGVRDSGGLEIHDIYDAVEAIKADPAFSGLIDPGNVHITGYSGGGGNTMSALTKFPDYFRVGAAFFGMSDYGYDLNDGWYNNGAGSRTSQLNIDIGNPNTGGNAVLDRYLARASNLASKNNPYSEIHLFVNSNETICPVWNDTSYEANADAAESFAGEFNNITVHIGGLGAYQDFNSNSINDANELQSWPHQGSPTSNEQDAAELWYRDRLLAGTIPQPALNNSDELRVAGFVKTSKFDLWLGDGQNAAADLTYSLSSTLKTFSFQIASSDTAVTGDLTVNTADMAGRQVSVELDNVVVGSFSGGGFYTYSGLGHNETLELIDSGPAVNNPPTLTAFAAAVTSTLVDTEVEIAFADLAAQGDEADSDGTVEAFVVQTVSSGTLSLGASAGTATAFASGTNDTVDASTNAYWTPAAGVTGSGINAFTVVVRDDDLAESTPPIQATVEVNSTPPPNTPPTLTAFASAVETTPVDTEVEISFADLAAQGDEADSDGAVEAFVVQAVSSGSLKLGTNAGTATAYASGTNDTINASTSAYWTPAAGATGSAINAFTVVARDDDLAESSPAVQANVEVTTGGPGPSAAIMVDFNDRVGDQLTQTGYTAITQTGGSFSSDLAVGGTVTVGIAVDGTNPAGLDDRDRGALVGGPGLAQSDLLRDFLFFNSAYSTRMDITVSTLQAGTYTFTGYFHDSNVGHNPFDLSVNTGSGFSLMVDEANFSTGTSPNPVGISSFNFTSDGTNPVIFRIDDINGTVVNGVIDNTGVIAGFEIVPSGAPNLDPALTSFAGPIGSTLVDTEVELSFADLASQGDETDPDGLVNAFVVQAVSSGTLKLGTNSASATAFAPGTNDTIDSTTQAYWTPASGIPGSTVAAFTVVARDNDMALSSPPVTATVQVVTVQVFSDLIAYYDFEDDVQDSSGNGNHGTAMQGLSYSATVPPALSHSTKSGEFNGGDGTGAYVDLGSLGIHDLAQSGGISISMWVRSDQTTQQAWVFGEGNDTDADTAYVLGNLSTAPAKFSSFVRNDAAQGGPKSTAGDGMAAGTWHHIVYTDDGGVARVWIDGVLDSGDFSYTPTGTYTFQNTSLGTWIRGGADRYNFDGLMDDVSIYSKVLSAGEIAALAAGANPLAASNTFADWIAGYPAVGLLTGANDDFDHDGIGNALENHFGTSPAVFSAGVVATGRSGNTFTFTHPLGDTLASDITAAYCWSKDLTSFHADGETADGNMVTFSQSAPADGMVEVTATISGTSLDRLFVVIKATRN